MITPTIITSEEQIYLAGTAINLRFRNDAADSNIQSVVCNLYIWSGQLNTPPTLPTHIFIPEKVSKSDKYINLSIDKYIAAKINSTKFAWRSGNNAPSISGEGVFWQIEYEVTNEDGSTATPVLTETNFATMGYRYDFEQVGDIAGSIEGQPYLGLLPINMNRNRTPLVAYFERTFDFTRTLGDCTSRNMILSTPYPIPSGEEVCQLGDTYLIAYINRLGLWDYFTPYGKAASRVKIDATTNPRLYRNPNSVNNNVNHSSRRSIDETKRAYTINTGGLQESMIDQVEEVMYSPLLYLIEFDGLAYTQIEVGLTVDDTTVTVDSTTITVDATTITVDDVGYFSTFKQIPVTCENNLFERKTRRNNKSKINYDFEFETTNGRINTLR